MRRSVATPEIDEHSLLLPIGHALCPACEGCGIRLRDVVRYYRTCQNCDGKGVVRVGPSRH